MSKLTRILALVLTAALLAGLCAGCANPDTPDTTTSTQATTSQKAVEALNGKKIIFIGNSYTFHGYCLRFIKEAVLTQAERTGDHGYFYQLCKRNGAEVNITNWCFGGHNLSDIFYEPCTLNKDCKGTEHKNYLTDTYFDYVVLQPTVEKSYAGDLAAYLKPVMDLFREANPDVKFILHVPHMACEKEYAWVADVDQAKALGITVCNWGQMCHDIVQGKTQVPGATQSYGRPTFVVSASESDGYHQNLLVGYLTALMIYSAITGDSPVGRPYDFCDDSTIDPQFNLEDFKNRKYVYEPYTNFIEVFRSEPDMLGLQQLVDQYLKQYN